VWERLQKGVAGGPQQRTRPQDEMEDGQVGKGQRQKDTERLVPITSGGKFQAAPLCRRGDQGVASSQDAVSGDTGPWMTW